MWHKYPNSKCTHVVSIDTINRSIDPQTGIIRTERVLGCKQKAPMWIVKVGFIPMLARISTYIYPSVIWRLGRCIRPRNIFCWSSHSKRYNHICQPLPITIRDLLRANPLYTCFRHPDILPANSRNSGPDGTLAVSSGRSRKMACTAIRAKRPTGEIWLHWCPTEPMGRTTSGPVAGRLIRHTSLLHFDFSLFVISRIPLFHSLR